MAEINSRGLLPLMRKRPYSRGPAERTLKALLLRTTAAAPAISAETAVETGVFYAGGIPTTPISPRTIAAKAGHHEHRREDRAHHRNIQGQRQEDGRPRHRQPAPTGRGPGRSGQGRRRAGRSEDQGCLRALTAGARRDEDPAGDGGLG